MALTPSTSYTQDVSDVNAGTVADTTPDYGTGGNPVRSAAANYLLWCKTDKDGNRVFDNPDFGDVLAIMSWAVVVTLSGWYERMLMRIQIYSGATPYVPGNAVYYGAENKVYQCILATTGNLPTNATYWAEVTDLSTLIANSSVSVTITNTYVRSTVDQKMKELFGDLGRNCACDDLEVVRACKLDALLISADAEVENGNYDDMAAIIAYLEQQLTEILVS